MKTILQIGIEVNSGSTGRIAEQIGEVALSKGWKSYITYARGFNPSKSDTIKIGTKLNIYYHILQTRFLGNHLQSSTSATHNLIKKIKEINPDIIQLHQLHGYFLNLEVLFSFLATFKNPVVWTLHDCWAFTGHCAYFSLINCEKWESLCGRCPQIHKYPKSFVDKSTANFHLKNRLFNSVPNFTLVTVSDWLNGLVKKSFLKNHQVLTIQNGVDVRQFFPRSDVEKVRRKYNIPDHPVIMGVGTIWTQSKGLYDYFKLRKVLPENINIVLVGLSDQQVKELPDGIVGIKRTESITELAELYSMANIVTSLSYQEAFGLTPVEGFACGTPAIVYNATALPELVNPEVGILVEPGNLDEIKGAVLKILHNGKDYYKSNCIETAKKNFDVSKKYESYFSLYMKLISGQ